MKRLLPVLLLFATVPAGAQYIASAPSADPVRPSFRPTQFIAPGALMAAGVSIHFFAHQTWDYGIRDGVLNATARQNIAPFDDYIQYVPMTLHLGLGLTGIPSRQDIWGRLIESAIAHAVCGIIMWPSKTLFHTLRPNEVNYVSFPSGHTAFSFTGATLTWIDYGWAWGTGAYAISTTVAFMRVWRNWHWLSDVLAGAGVGILSAYAGSWLVQPVKDLLGIRSDARSDIALVPSWDPFSRTACLRFGLAF